MVLMCNCRLCRAAAKEAACTGHCNLPRHRCLEKEDVKPGPIPKHLGWLYTAKDSPEHQLRCGWRPGHISCPVLRRMERVNCAKCGACEPCGPVPSCSKPAPCAKPCCIPPKCIAICPSTTSTSKAPVCMSSKQPLIRIIRHGGQYKIVTEPSDVSNAPSGPYPLKYVLNCDPNDKEEGAKFSVEAKFNDYHFDYTCSQSSFVLDFAPPPSGCAKPCPRKSVTCMNCHLKC